MEPAADATASPWASPGVQELMGHVEALTGLANAIIDVDGKVLAASGWQELCTRFHRVNPETCRHCVESDVYLSANLNQGHSALYRCKNDLWDMATPLVVDGQHVANVFSGQFLLADEPVDVAAFERRAAEHGFDREAYLAALARVPRVSEARARQVLDFQAALARVLVQVWRGSRAALEAEGIRLRAAEQERLALALGRLGAIVESSSDAIVGIDLEGYITSWNRGAERIYGYPAAEVIGRRVDLLAPPDRKRETLALVEAVKRGEAATPLQTVRLRKDGTPVEVSIAISPIRDTRGNVVGLSNIARDITEERRAEAELRTASHYARSLIEASLDPLVTISPEGKITDVNRATEEATGRAREELIGTDFADYFTEPDRAREGYQRVLAEGRVTDYALTLRHRSGRTSDVLYNASTYRNEAGTLQGVFAAARDVTERKRAADALQAERDRVRAIMEASPVAMIRVRRDGCIDFANAAAQEVMGLERSAIQARTYDAPQWGITDWDGNPFPPEKLPFAQVLRTGRPVAVNHAVTRPDGRRVLLSVRGAPLLDASGQLEGAVFGVEDATERRRLEEQVRQSQKLEAVGRLAGGVAHDFNNLLTAILSGSDALLGGLISGDPLREEAKDIHEAAFRASSLTRQLLIFSRKQVVQPTLVDLWEVVAGLERMLRRLIGEDVELVTRGGPGSLVLIDPGQVEQVIVNLAVNARDAMPRGGRLVLETEAVDLGEEVGLAHPGLAPGPYVMLAVTDTGCGMTAEVQSHLFEPFFTTKAPGKGTGLGLSTVYGIVTQAGGHVWAYSEPGRGTVFKVYLPRVQAEQPPRRVDAPAPAARGTETVLLVEDERLVRKLAVKVLAGAGFKVLEAADGREALDVASSCPPLAALVTDVVMPRMRGDELAAHLRELHPGIQVLFISGYTEPGVSIQHEIDEGSGFLQKPFAAATLVRRLRELLDRKAARERPA